MFDSPTARGFGNTVDTATADAYPGELPSWNYSDVMKGLDQFMEMVPNFATSSEGSEGVTQADPGLNEALNQQTTDATDKSTAAKRRQYKNKLAQKRFRERQKVRNLMTRGCCWPTQCFLTQGSNLLQARSDELEARVKATSARLEEMTRKQKSLEARNTMLEKLIDLDKQHTIVPHIATVSTLHSQHCPEHAPLRCSRCYVLHCVDVHCQGNARRHD